MRLMQNNVIIAAWLLAIVLYRCESRRQSQLTIIDNNIKTFMNAEERHWSEISSSTNPKTANATLHRLYVFFGEYLNETDIGRIEAVRSVNHELADKIDQIKRTQRESISWLNEKQYHDAKQKSDNILQSIPNLISQVFDITKNPGFLNYIRDNTDFCQTNSRIVSSGVEKLNLQNVVQIFFTTIAETLTKAYMATQMAYMLNGAKAQRKCVFVFASISFPIIMCVFFSFHSAARKYQTGSIEFRQSFTSHYDTLEKKVKPIIENFTGEIWNCDDFSKESILFRYHTKTDCFVYACSFCHLLSDSYTEITNFIQGYIDNEVNFNQEGSCKETCSDYQLVEKPVCRNNTLCILNYLDKNKIRCDGKIRSCRFIESDMTMCPNVWHKF